MVERRRVNPRCLPRKLVPLHMCTKIVDQICIIDQNLNHNHPAEEPSHCAHTELNVLLLFAGKASAVKQLLLTNYLL